MTDAMSRSLIVQPRSDAARDTSALDIVRKSAWRCGQRCEPVTPRVAHAPSATVAESALRLVARDDRVACSSRRAIPLEGSAAPPPMPATPATAFPTHPRRAADGRRRDGDPNVVVHRFPSQCRKHLQREQRVADDMVHDDAERDVAVVEFSQGHAPQRMPQRQRPAGQAGQSGQIRRSDREDVVAEAHVPVDVERGIRNPRRRGEAERAAHQPRTAFAQRRGGTSIR